MSDLECVLCMQRESSEAVLVKSVGECEAALSWQASVAPVEAVALDT